MARSIKKEIKISGNQEKVFTALTTPSYIKAWWKASQAIIIPQQNGLYVVSWGAIDQPDYVSSARISTYQYPTQLVLSDYQYYSPKAGPLPFENDLPVVFDILPDHNSVLLTVEQTGFPESSSAEGFYQACIKGWEDVLLAIKEVTETS